MRWISWRSRRRRRIGEEDRGAEGRDAGVLEPISRVGTLAGAAMGCLIAAARDRIKELGQQSVVEDGRRGSIYLGETDDPEAALQEKPDSPWRSAREDRSTASTSRASLLRSSKSVTRRAQWFPSLVAVPGAAEGRRIPRRSSPRRPWPRRGAG